MNISVDATGTIKGLNAISLVLKSKSQEILKRLVLSGYTIADYAYGDAEYDGTKDISLSMNFNGNTAELVASGSTVLFVEFGTGIVFTDENPKAAQLGFIRGTYGKGRGSNLSWTYVGEPGSNGEIIHEKQDGSTVVKTQGNPPANAMYEASKTIRNEMITVVREVLFGD